MISVGSIAAPSDHRTALPYLPSTIGIVRRHAFRLLLMAQLKRYRTQQANSGGNRSRSNNHLAVRASARTRLAGQVTEGVVEISTFTSWGMTGSEARRHAASISAAM